MFGFIKKYFFPIPVCHCPSCYKFCSYGCKNGNRCHKKCHKCKTDYEDEYNNRH